MNTMRAGTALGPGLAITGMSLRVLWGRYLAVGGSHTTDELLDYLNGTSEWTEAEHDAAAQALNECCATMGLGYPVAYACELSHHTIGALPPAANPCEAHRSREGHGAVDAQERQQMGEELLVRAAALRLVGRALAEEVSQNAARIAQTFHDIARVQDAIAINGVFTTDAHVREHTEHAERARRFAQHERTEQHRWSQQAHDD